ncbi:DUF6600 domain-containing protein [Undibacterium sp. Ren11W]|uniref:DUF6600 domain-containing protein n=1 Tax=Undibacterium sp. Ren11W TaxID=3413045 RepID=UPI003BF256B4
MPAFQQYSLRLALAVLLLCQLFTSDSALAQEDPPSRVARLSYTQGSISLAPAGSEQWIVADPNRPLTSGDRLWVPAGARAELHMGASSLRLAENTSLSISELSDNHLQLSLTAGTLVLRQRSLGTQEVVEINTPNFAFTLQEAGEYKLSAYPNESRIIVRRGTGIAYGESDSITLHEAEQANFSGNNLAHNSIDRMPPYDSFDLWVNDRDKLEDNSVSARYVSREVIGYQQLDQHGTWETHAEYGAIWIPRTVDVGWAPYRNGNWVWVAPWGWTWVDRAPWGFAPFHYGRWAHIGPRWAWVPGPYLHHTSPVYAPALVAFVGGAPGVHLNLNISTGSHPHPAWLPLAPGEAYRPYYRGSSGYIDRLNQHQDYRASVQQNSSQERDHHGSRPYQNQAIQNAISSMPANQFLRGQASSLNPATLGSPFSQSTAAIAPATARPPSRESIYGNARRLSAPANEQWLQRPVVQRPDSGRISRDGEHQAASNNERYTPRYGARIATPPGENQTTPAEIRTRASPVMSTPVAATPERARSNAVDYRAPVNNHVNPTSNPAAASVAPVSRSTPGYAGWTQNNPAQVILQEREHAREPAHEPARDAERQREQLERRTEHPSSRRNENERENYGVRYQSSGSNQAEQNQRRTDAARTAQESNNNTRSTIAPAINSAPTVRPEAAHTSPPPEIKSAPQPRPERAGIAEPKENPRNTHRPGQAREQER